eukprot:1145819-Pelagomonas_calceolata.AAC.4
MQLRSRIGSLKATCNMPRRWARIVQHNPSCSSAEIISRSSIAPSRVVLRRWLLRTAITAIPQGKLAFKPKNATTKQAKARVRRIPGVHSDSLRKMHTSRVIGKTGRQGNPQHTHLAAQSVPQPWAPRKQDPMSWHGTWARWPCSKSCSPWARSPPASAHHVRCQLFRGAKASKMSKAICISGKEVSLQNCLLRATAMGCTEPIQPCTPSLVSPQCISSSMVQGQRMRFLHAPGHPQVHAGIGLCGSRAHPWGCRLCHCRGEQVQVAMFQAMNAKEQEACPSGDAREPVVSS